MSVQAMGYVLKLTLKDSVAKFVLLCMANYADSEGATAFPSVARLERDTELGESTIRRKIDWLEEHGYLKRGDQEMAAAWAKRADRQPICYDIVLRGPAVTPREPTGSRAEQNGVPERAPRGPAAGPNPSLTINDPKSAPAAAVELPGRASSFDAEFKRRFGYTPDEASAMRAKAKL